MALTSFECSQCHDSHNISAVIGLSRLLSDPNRLGKGFEMVQCPSCLKNVYQCLQCAVNYSAGNWDRRVITRHVSRHAIEDCTRLDPADDPPDDNWLGPIDAEFESDQALTSLETRVEGVMVPENDDEEDDFVENLLLSVDEDSIETDGPADSHALYRGSQLNVATQYTMKFDEFRPFSQERNNAYYYQNMVAREHLFGGLCGVTWRAMKRQKSYSIGSSLCVDDAKLAFLITKKLINSTFTEKEELIEILDGVVSRLATNNGSGVKAQMRVPVSMDDANRICLEGKFAIFKNLPSEEIFNIGGHACISLNEKLSHMLAQGVPMRYMEDVHGNVDDKTIHGTPAAKDLLKHMKSMNPTNIPTAYGYLTSWSDSFIGCWVKQKENSAWILTITVADPDGKATSPYHTHCIAIGQAKLDHTPVIEYFLRELDIVRNGVVRYCALSRAFIRTQFDLLAYLMDRPERSKVTKILDRGTYVKRSLFAANVDTVHLPLCSACYNKLVRIVLGGGGSMLTMCRNCCQWDFESDSPSAKKSCLPKDYPTSFYDNTPEPPQGRTANESYLRGLPLTMSSLTQGVKVAEHNIKHKHWNKCVMEDYLRSVGVGTETQVKVYNNNKDGNPDNACSIPEFWKIPRPLRICIECVMHQVFEGVTEDIMTEVHTFMKHNKVKATFEKVANRYMNEISTFRIDWLRTKYLPATQWLAEDYLGYSRMMPFLYGTYFLQVRAPDNTQVSKETMESLKQVLNSLHVMIGLLMTPTEPNIDLIDMHIKLFLSCCDRYAKSYYAEGTTPFWSTKGNFLSLLNLPEQIRYFGPLRWYWEGVCERFIQTVKCVLSSMRKTTSYYEKKLQLVQKLNTMQWLKEALSSKRNNERESYKGYYRYDNVEHLKTKLNEGLPISGFSLKNKRGLIFVAVGRSRGTGKQKIVPMRYTTNGDGVVKHCGFAYLKYTLLGGNIITATAAELKERIEANALLLPYVENGRDFEKSYATIFDDWDILDSRGNKGIPTICEILFAFNVLP